MLNGCMKSKSLVLQTLSGLPVWRLSGKYMVQRQSGAHHASCIPSQDSEGNRNYNLKQAEKQTGEKCQWIDGPEIEHFNY